MAFFGLFGRRKRSHVQDKLDSLTVEEKRERIEDRRTARELVLKAVEMGRPELADAASILRPTRGRPPLRLGGANSLSEQFMQHALMRALEDPEERMERMEDAALRRRERMKRLAEDDLDDDDRSSKGLLRELMPLAPLLAIPLLANNPQAAAAIGPFIAGALGGGQQPEAPTAPAPQVIMQPVQQQAIVEPQPQPAETDGDPSTDQPFDQTEMPNVLSGLKPRVVLANLELMDAPMFASWLIHQPQGGMVADMLAKIDTTDPQSVLAEYAANPFVMALGWRPVITWLQEHESKAIDIVEELRAINNQLAADAGI